jgi:hypothetical protein
MAGKTGSKGKRGGARNYRGRISYELTKRHCLDLINAAIMAQCIGLPFNRWITIAWGRNGIDPRDNRRLTGLFLKKAGEWMRRRDRKLVWAYVQEGSDRFGPHVHMLLHVPGDLDDDWRHAPKRWVKLVLGMRPVRGTYKSEILATGANEASDPATYQTVLTGKVHYMLKAAPKALERELDMIERGHKPWGQRCLVHGPRLVIWQGWKFAMG